MTCPLHNVGHGRSLRQRAEGGQQPGGWARPALPPEQAVTWEPLCYKRLTLGLPAPRGQSPALPGLQTCSDRRALGEAPCPSTTGSGTDHEDGAGLS